MFKLTRTGKAQAIAALIKICISSINWINFNTFRKNLNEKLTTQTKLENNNKEVQTLISLKLVFVLLSCLDEPRKNFMKLSQFLMSWFRVQMHGNILSKLMSFKRKIMNALLFSSWFTWNKSCQFIRSLGNSSLYEIFQKPEKLTFQPFNLKFEGRTFNGWRTQLKLQFLNLYFSLIKYPTRQIGQCIFKCFLGELWRTQSEIWTL